MEENINSCTWENTTTIIIIIKKHITVFTIKTMHTHETHAYCFYPTLLFLTVLFIQLGVALFKGFTVKILSCELDHSLQLPRFLRNGIITSKPGTKLDTRMQILAVLHSDSFFKKFFVGFN